jgi:site-specific DNA-methyltransferase (adenine-specific)
MNPFYKDELITIYYGDCRDVLPNITGDLLMMDPPYGMGDVWIREDVGKLVRRELAEWDRDFDPTAYPFRDLPLVAFTVDWRIPEWYSIRPKGRLMAWTKTNYPHNLRGHVISNVEWIFFDAKFIYREYANSRASIIGPSEQNRQHPAQKPLWLMSELLQMFEGKVVIDPFMGAGTTLRAAKELGIHAIGIDVKEEYCEISANRCRQEIVPLVSKVDIIDVEQEKFL